ncbi:MAG: TusE/DsrC/DsvC family sulfur relay protein [Pseudomonadota bacterium]
MPDLDKEGYLMNLTDWSEDVARELAAQHQITLTETHWQVIRVLQAFYVETDVAPAMRPFVKLVKNELGEELGNSIRLMELFSASPAKMAARIAGLPRPTHCL